MRKILFIFSLSFALLIGIFAFSSVKAKADTDEIDLQYSYIYFNSSLSYQSFAPNTTTTYNIRFYSNGGYYQKISFIRDSSFIFRIRYYKSNNNYFDVYKYATGWSTPQNSYTSLDSYRYISIVGGDDTDNDTLSLFFQNNATITFNAELSRQDGFDEGYSDGQYDGFRDGYDDAVYDMGYINLVDYYSYVSIVAYDNNNNIINRVIRYSTSFDTLPFTSNSLIKSLNIYDIYTDSSISTLRINVYFKVNFKFESIYFRPLVNNISIDNTDFSSFTQPLNNLYLCNVESSSITDHVAFVLDATSYSSLNFYIMGYYADPSSMLAAYNRGYTSGHSAGYSSGYDNGYYEGLTNTNWLGNSLLSVVDIPFKVFHQTFDFNIFGINLYHLVMGFLTLGVVLWFWKKLH